MSMPECGDSCAAPQGSFGLPQISLDAIAQLCCPRVLPFPPPPPLPPFPSPHFPPPLSLPPSPSPSFLLKGVTDKTVQLLECYALL